MRRSSLEKPSKNLSKKQKASLQRGKRRTLKRGRSKGSIEKPDKEQQERAAFLGLVENEDEMKGESFLKFAGEAIHKAEFDNKTKLSNYNYHMVNFLVNGEIVECAVETVPEDTTHALESHSHVFFILSLLCCDVNNMMTTMTTRYFTYGAMCAIALVFVTIFIGFPCYITTLYIGSRFQGHANQVYMGFLGVVALQYIQWLWQLAYDSAALGSSFRLMLSNQFLYSTIYSKCIPSENELAYADLNLVVHCTDYQDMVLVNKSDWGHYSTSIVVAYFLLVCLSGGIYSWWKSSLICFAVVLVFSLSLCFLALSLDGALTGLSAAFAWKSISAKELWKLLLDMSNDILLNAMLIGYPTIEGIMLHCEHNFPVIRFSLYMSLLLIAVHIVIPLTILMLGSYVVYQFCHPPSWEQRKTCNSEEKYNYYVSFMDYKMTTIVGSYIAYLLFYIALSLKTDTKRIYTLMYNGTELASNLSRLMCFYYFVQSKIMLWKRLNKVLGWRSVSYILTAFAFAVFLAMTDCRVIDQFLAVQNGYAPFNLCSGFAYLIVLVNFVAVFWVYGAYNFLNDIYVSETKAKIFGLLMAIWCRYVLIGFLLLLAALSCLDTIDRYNNSPVYAFAMDDARTPLDGWQYIFFSVLSFYVLLIIVPLFACCSKRKKIADLKNLKQVYGFPELTLSKFASCLLGARKKAKRD